MRPLILIIAAGAVAVLLAFSFAQSRQDDSSSIYHDIRGPVEFVASLGGKVRAPYPSEEDEKTIDEASVEAIVAGLRERGAESLSQEDWQTLASVAWAALIMQQESVRYLFTGDDASGRQVQVIVEEEYEIPKSQGVEVPLISGWRTQPVSPQSGAGETMLLFDLSDLEGEFLLATTWECSDSECSCTTEDMGELYIWWGTLHFGRVARVGSFRGVETVDGRPAYAFDAPTGAEGEGSIGEGLRLWLDVETLLPRQFETLPSTGMIDSGGPNFFKYSKYLGRYTILEVNGEIDMEPPGECVEKEYDTPEGNEVSFQCPSEAVTYGMDTLLKEFEESYRSTRTPGEELSFPDLSDSPPAPVQPGTLAILLPPDPLTGRLVPSYTLNTNASVGCAGCGYWANEFALDQMGRLCGLSTSLGASSISASGDDIIISQLFLQLDYYRTTPGAEEAFQRQVEEEFDEKVEDVTLDVGDERQLFASTYEFASSGGSTTYSLLMRRRNIIVRLSDWDGEEQTGAVLEYAAQLDRNIEAAAQQQSE